MLEYLLNLIYPKKCVFCKKILTVENKQNEYICKMCNNSLPFILPNEIKYIKKRDLKYNLIRNYYFQDCISLFFYQKPISKTICDFKFYKKTSLTCLFSYYLSLLVNNFYKNIKFDYITCIPMFKIKEKDRGYNQSKLLALSLSKILKIPYKDLLLKIKNNKVQHNLSMKERALNVKDVYCINNKTNIENKSILLIDDIVTTGHTLNEAAKILKTFGAKQVYCATIATPKLKDNIY